MPASATERRLKGDLEFQETKLKNLFHSTYRDPERAWERWTKLVDSKGLDAAQARFKNAPRRFGKLQGRVWLGMFPDKRFKQRSLSIRNLPIAAERWQMARVQLHMAGQSQAPKKAKQVRNRADELVKDLALKREESRQSNRGQGGDRRAR